MDFARISLHARGKKLASHYKVLESVQSRVSLKGCPLNGWRSHCLSPPASRCPSPGRPVRFGWRRGLACVA